MLYCNNLVCNQSCHGVQTKLLQYNIPQSFYLDTVMSQKDQLGRAI